MKIPHDATERDYLKAILELLIVLAEKQHGCQVLVRVGSLEAESDLASARTQPRPKNVYINEAAAPEANPSLHQSAG